MSHIILLVDDSDDTREFMRIWLEILGYEVIEAINGSKAIECTKQSHPDLILMDIAMPVMDGITATAKIRKLEEGKNIPVIAVTGHTNWYQEAAIKAGCNNVMSKPLDHSSLEKVMSHYLH
jgi:two-component system sensor histidine kinase EvgS